MKIRLNARFRGRSLTGVERFATEVGDRLAKRDGITIAETAPSHPLAGFKGHAWEQFVLPRSVGREEILFSPCNTGPLAVPRQLVVIHDAAVWDGPEGFSRSFRTVYQQLLPRLAKRAAVVATVSQFSRTRLAPVLGIPEDRILVLGNAVSEAFSPGESRSSQGDGLTLLCVGSMDPRKNLGRLLRAWMSLQRNGRLPAGAKLQLIGGANPRNFAGMERIEGSGIEWLGRVDDAELVRCYREADAFVYPSLYEGFGLPPLEAMACGCPVLLSRAASLPEVGGPESEGAVRYFDPGSETEVASAIEGFLALDAGAREAMGQKALDRASRFTWESIAEKVAGAMASI
jgi:glycosyltransferase involved in cell wall biosynthesis